MVIYESHYDKPLDYKDIIYQKEAPIARIILNRPEKMNALRHQLRGEVFHALKVAELDKDVRVIIIKGNGRCFSAGYDLGTGNDGFRLPDVGPVFAKWPDGSNQHLVSGWQQLRDIEKPIIAQGHGYVLAGGTEFASQCDLFVVADDCQIGFPPVRSMTVPHIQWFPLLMNRRKAYEYMFTGDSFTGTEAVELGVANYAVPLAELDEFTTKLAKRIALISPHMLALSKRQLNKAFEALGHDAAISQAAIYDMLGGLRPDAGDFGRIRGESGLKAALNDRDEKFGDYGTTTTAQMARDARKRGQSADKAPQRSATTANKSPKADY
ncbi:MAG: enoyl-CoA hydratase [Dehalococcoidia bacterium]|nr:enoyl-CoA hydratase [Dehalococcoidia bacterium]